MSTEGKTSTFLPTGLLLAATRVVQSQRWQ